MSKRPAPRDKLLAEWFWIDRWDGSSASLLPMEPRGLYREMLTQAWRRGASLPNDPEAIQRAIRCTPAEWSRCWPKIKRFWRVKGFDLVNDTQLEVYAEALAAKERASERGRTAARAKHKHSTSTAQAPLENNPPSPSPSPSPFSVSDTVSVTGREGRAAAVENPPTAEPDGGNGAVPSRSPGRDQAGREAVVSEVMELVRQLARRHPEVDERVWVRRASEIPAADGRPAKSFEDPRSRGLPLPWLETTARKLREMRDEARRPPPL